MEALNREDCSLRKCARNVDNQTIQCGTRVFWGCEDLEGPLEPPFSFVTGHRQLCDPAFRLQSRSDEWTHSSVRIGHLTDYCDNVGNANDPKHSQKCVARRGWRTFTGFFAGFFRTGAFFVTCWQLRMRGSWGARFWVALGPTSVTPWYLAHIPSLGITAHNLVPRPHPVPCDYRSQLGTSPTSRPLRLPVTTRYRFQ